MVTEIELKAKVENSEALRILLIKKAEYLGKFEKEDTYWTLPRVLDPVPTRLRIRMEKRTLPDGREESLTIATYKTKELRANIEINDEREFAVNPASEFEEFLTLMGLKPDIKKRKLGWAFSRDGIKAELTEVKGLGWFVELEILTDNKEENTINEGKKRLLDFLSELGIEKKALETRFYTEMLRELAGR